MNMVIPLNPSLIDLIFTNEIYSEILNICLHDDISVQIIIIRP